MKTKEGDSVRCSQLRLGFGVCKNKTTIYKLKASGGWRPICPDCLDRVNNIGDARANERKIHGYFTKSAIK